MWIKEYIIIASIVLLAFIVGYLIWYIKNKRRESEIRKDFKKRSTSVKIWQAIEQIVWLLPWFKYNLKDMMFLWKWVDYIVFDWLSSWKLEKIVFLEIKTWKSQLNKNEKSIKNAVNSGKVSYEVYRK